MRGSRALLTLAAALCFAVPSPVPAQDATASGVFLVAKPQLNDPNFRESVVLVTQHAGGSPVGVIINRPTRLSLAEVFPENEKLKGLPDALFFG
ncbi:MAG TPA: YqgE/AlgH family protein, partial [Burkholderiales bacterium]